MVRVPLRDLGLMDLLKALVTWTIVLLVITTVILKLPKQLIAYINENPLESARRFAEFFMAMVSPWAHQQYLALIYEVLGIPPLMLYMAAAVVDMTLITMFGTALLSGLRLLLGTLTVFRGQRMAMGIAALAGSSMALAGPALALAGLFTIMATEATPVVSQGMRIVINPPLVYASIPLPWPIIYGTMLWLVGIAVTGAALLISAVKAMDMPTAVLTAILTAGAVISLIGLAVIGFVIMSIAAGALVIMNRGVGL